MLILHVPVPHLSKEMDLPVKVGTSISLSLTFQIYNTTVPDPCNSGPCDTNAECTRDSVLNANFTCTCTSPFEGDGFTCESRYTSST